MCVKDGQIYFTCQVSATENVIRTVQEDVPDTICEGAGKLRGIQYYGGFFYVVDKGEERALKCDGNGNILQNTESNFLNDSYGIHVDKNNVFVCSAMDNNICVLDPKELNHRFFIPDIEKPMDITYFEGLYFVTSRQQRSGAIVILDIDFDKQKYTSTLINNADGNRFGGRIRGICANGEYLYVTERGNPNDPHQGGRILCLKYERNPFPLSLWHKHKLRCVSVFTPQEHPHLPIDIACDSENTIYYSAQNKEKNEYFVAKLVEHPKGTINGYEIIYP